MAKNSPFFIFILLSLSLSAPLRANESCPPLVYKNQEWWIADLEGRFDSFFKKINQGLKVTLVHAFEYENTRQAFGCSVTYDLWEEHYHVSTLSGLNTHQLRAKNEIIVDELKTFPKSCLHIPFSLKTKKTKRIQIITQLDPVSEEQAQKTREWLAAKGIGSGSEMMGRAMGAVVKWDQSETYQRSCIFE